MVNREEEVLEGIIAFFERGSGDLARFLDSQDLPMLDKIRVAQLAKDLVYRHSAPELWALFGFDLFPHLLQLKELGFRFRSWKTGGKKNYWEFPGALTDTARAYVEALPDTVEAELVRVDTAESPTFDQLREWKRELIRLSRGTNFVVHDSGVACRVTKGRGGINQIVNSYVLYRKWVYTIRAAKRKITGESA